MVEIHDLHETLIEFEIKERLRTELKTKYELHAAKILFYQI